MRMSDGQTASEFVRLVTMANTLLGIVNIDYFFFMYLLRVMLVSYGAFLKISTNGRPTQWLVSASCNTHWCLTSR
jgi:hypothetical protein